MKKVMTILMVFVLVFALTACEPDVIANPQVPQNNLPQDVQQNDSQTTQQAVQQQTPQTPQTTVQQIPPQQPQQPQQPVQKPAATDNNYIGEAKAKQIALNDAGVIESNTQRLRVTFDFDDGRAEYEVDFHVGTTEYDYEINAVTGAIIDKDIDYDDFD